MQDNTNGSGNGGNGNQSGSGNGNKDGNGSERRPNIMFFVVISFLALLVISYFAKQSSAKNGEVTYDEFIKAVSENKVESISIESDRIIITAKPEDDKVSVGKVYFTGLAEDTTTLTERMLEAGVKVSSSVENGSGLILNILLTYVLPLVILWVAMGFLFSRIGRSGGFGFGVGKSNAKMYEGKETGITFKDVAGEDEAKESLVEIVDFLHNPGKYSKIGAKIPKGALLVGPPGTGKTLLAKAVAGEAGVPFFSLAGSDFVELYVGVGASRVRDLFKEAEKNAPCIVFIDEIDAIGRSRDSKFGGNDEREQTLNQLLSEMDGFDARKGIILLAATNRPEVLDKALLRPGRFDRRIIVEEPDLKGRVEILKVHAKNVLLDQTVDLDEIALATVGAVGADLANMINEGAILAVKRGREYVSQKDMLDAVELVSLGKEKKDRILSKKERQVVSYHETGHALISALQKNTEPVQKITIIPRTMGTLGYVLSYPEEEKFMQTEKELRAELVSLLGGRAAEDIVFDTVTTGAANDIEKATRIARAMITRFGMSKRFGMMQIESVENQYLDRSTTLNCADETAAAVDEEVMKIIKESYKEAKTLLKENREILDKIAAYLIEKETITGHEFMEIFCKEKGIPVPERNRGEESLAKLKKDREEERSGETQHVSDNGNAATPVPVQNNDQNNIQDNEVPENTASDNRNPGNAEDKPQSNDFAAELNKRAYRENGDDPNKKH
ncbi:MAG: ATP-dependent zinc metalloprotease FtsH [Lachnospiraceae bacterium]|nr:ATP-dependent zinc metalloprotease FtsH [Lachnospiraceae bacterium]